MEVESDDDDERVNRNEGQASQLDQDTQVQDMDEVRTVELFHHCVFLNFHVSLTCPWFWGQPGLVLKNSPGFKNIRLQKLWRSVVVWTYYANTESNRRLCWQQLKRGGSASGATPSKGGRGEPGSMIG